MDLLHDKNPTFKLVIQSLEHYELNQLDEVWYKFIQNYNIHEQYYVIRHEYIKYAQFKIYHDDYLPERPWMLHALVDVIPKSEMLDSGLILTYLEDKATFMLQEDLSDKKVNEWLRLLRYSLPVMAERSYIPTIMMPFLGEAWTESGFSEVSETLMIRTLFLGSQEFFEAFFEKLNPEYRPLFLVKTALTYFLHRKRYDRHLLDNVLQMYGERCIRDIFEFLEAYPDDARANAMALHFSLELMEHEKYAIKLLNCILEMYYGSSQHFAERLTHQIRHWYPDLLEARIK